MACVAPWTCLAQGVVGVSPGGDTLPSTNQPRVSPPSRRQLRTFAFDPMSTRLSGKLLTLDIPFEVDLRPGPCGELLEVVDFDATRNAWYAPVDLNDPLLLVQQGLRPVEGDPRAHQQVVYAVAMSVIERFERFLGRRFRWRGKDTLRLVPHAFEGRNAFFDPRRGAVLFGYYRADRRDPGRNLPGQVVFTCLSTDIIAHEVTHALVHRLRRYFTEATNGDVFAWHEAFADLIALFQHFAHREVVEEVIADTRGDLRQSSGLVELAREFGESSGRRGALRSAIGTPATPDAFRSATEPHQRGACFVAAVFDAYLETYQARIADLVRLATGGSGVLPPGRLPPDLVTRAAEEAVVAADRTLGMVVRAFDYLPVVDVTFGDVVRAIVTSDRKLYPNDPANLRGILVEAMRRRGIYPERVASLAVDELVWPAPAGDVLLEDPQAPVHIGGLILSATKDLDMTGEAGEFHYAAGPEASDRSEFSNFLYRALNKWVRLHALEVGLDPAVPIGLTGIHVSYHLAEDRQPRPEVVIQFTQRRVDLENPDVPKERRVAFRAGTTLVASAAGRVECVIAKPLPLTPATFATLPAGHVAHAFQVDGEKRLAALARWIDDVDDGDALSAWTTEPATKRLDFAALHSGLG